eukprot:GHVT01073909.1.p2 GENE.GHVT01073909.1~~GHVT01073909.1.p2  ORF type:complete len:196 (-),score=49.31 GHVT01073909.1:489-1076(-)
MCGGLRDLRTAVSLEFNRMLGEQDKNRFVYYNQANRAIRISNSQHPKSRSSFPSSSSASFSSSADGGNMTGRPAVIPGCLAANELKDLALIHDLFLNSHTSFLPSSSSARASSSCCLPPYRSQPHRLAREVHSNTSRDIHTVAIKEGVCPWVQGKYVQQREIFFFLDTPKASFTMLQKESSRFGAYHFSTIFTTI